MASPVFFIFFLTLVIRALVSMTIPLDVSTVKLSDVRETELTERSPAVLDPHLRPSEETELMLGLTSVDAVPSFDSGAEEHSRRVRRSLFLTPVKCAGDMFEYGDRCLTKEQYNGVMKDYEDQ